MSSITFKDLVPVQKIILQILKESDLEVWQILNLLKAGEINSYITMHGTIIPIPTTYWGDVEAGEFKPAVKSGSGYRAHELKVTTEELIAYYIELIPPPGDGSDTQVSNDLLKCIKALNDRAGPYDVNFETSQVDRLCHKGVRLIKEPAAGGAPEKYDWDEFWRQVVRVALEINGVQAPHLEQLKSKMQKWINNEGRVFSKNPQKKPPSDEYVAKKLQGILKSDPS